jgi:HlyD family secretion protein
MIGTTTRGKTLLALTGALCLLSAAGCNDRDPNRIQGYVEGEFVYVASPLAGTLEYLYVHRGMQVEAGASLFALENTPEKAARDEATRRLASARANLEDLKKPKRPPEIESLEAQLRQAKISLAYSERNLARQENVPPSATSEEELDRARTAYNQDRQRVAQLEADLQTARLGARPDQIEAAQANVRALEAVLAKAEWELAQKQQSAPREGLVFDTLFRPGEWVAAGRPVVVLLPPQNIKVRAFIPEPRIGAVKLGQQVNVHVDGVAAPHVGTVSFISPRAEYTPPVIYSRESRAKLVFMIEVVFDAETAVNLHPGQPVDVQLVD